MKTLQVLLIILTLSFSPGMVYSTQQQQVVVKGEVVSESGEPLMGVTVYHEESGAYTVTGFDGDFELGLPVSEGVLQISYLGYKSREEAFSTDHNNLTIILTEDVTALDEVLVVGYGTQKKENLTGAVDQVSSDVFENRPITNLSQGLQGAIANLNIIPADGKPTQSATFNIRGATSIGQGGNALVLIDGVQGDPALLNPNDIATVSVLKDASSAAIYGARGAFGVVLITTKNPGKSKMSVTYSSNISIKTPTVLPDYVTDGYTWASMFNEAFSSWNNYASTPQNVNVSMNFSQEYLAELHRRSLDPDAPIIEIDPVTGEYVYYDSTDWMDLLYKNSTHAVDHNISISGGTEKADFYVTGQVLKQPGLFRYNSDDYAMYNFRAKASMQLFPWLKVGNNASFSNTKYHNPIIVGGNGDVWRVMAAAGFPMSPVFNPDGTLTHTGAFSIGDLYYGKNSLDKDNRVFRNTTNFEADFLDHAFKVKGDFTYQSTGSYETRRRVPVPYSRTRGVIDYLGAAYNDYRVIDGDSEYLAGNIYGEYSKSIHDTHNFKVLGGFNYESNTFKRVGMQRNGLLFEDASDINLAVGESMITSGGYEKWVIAGGFFRFNYDFRNRYLLEVNGRYDGSSKFPEDQRYAFFPSVSVGWNIASEPFWKVPDEIVSNLKVRASYGSLGNGNISSYMFQELLSIGRLNKILNGELPSYTTDPSVLPDGLTWETVTTKNIGVDLAMLRNRLSLSMDAYVRTTRDMFTAGPELPAIFGAGSPRGNYADLETRGWEASLSWRDGFDMAAKPFNYGISVNLADNITKILKYNNPTRRLNDYYEGQILGEIWGKVTDGFFLSALDVKTSADQSLFSTTAVGVWRPGDIKFRDLNNDGIIDNGENTADKPGDRKVIGNSRPRYLFGVNLNADWNNIFFNAFIQGVGKQDWYPSRGASDFWGQYNAPYSTALKSHIGNIWTPENTDAYFPRYTGYLAWAAGGALREVQTRYLQNAAYVRLKNLQIGYNIPDEVLSRIGISKLQVYASGENLFSFSPLYKNTKALDVENIGASDQDVSNQNYGDGFNYPILRSVSLGFSLTF
ncbi:SusC/RagA family TonB-linked outer membrane protein [Sinomicrobium soli]|uniref:SusC/RagA family TonB-linked outer membrane protein n=1 Tax=Sinomicrobium sp. N-1-3-6 TaxID=2219864 RepID=UPI000DCE9FC1|nr:TonB-dependent receptor [Sinomicrobium sp. N-1-3-6]RAV28431.1 SusC/RagA family protein [Sinomicrobium sp. N-1-3-6]